MRVVQSVFTWLPLTQHWLWIQIGHLPPRIESTVVASCSTGDASPARPSVRVLRLGSWEPARLSRRLSRRLRARLLRRAIEESDAALVHSHFGDQAWEDVGTVRRSGRAHVATFYGYDVGWLPRSSPAWRERYALIFAAVDRV